MTARSLATTCTRINGAWTRQITIFVGRSVDEIQLTGTISLEASRLVAGNITAGVHHSPPNRTSKARNMARPEGLAPPTLCLEARSSNQARRAAMHSVGSDARFFVKSLKTFLKGSFFRSAVVPGKFISLGVDLFFVAFQFPHPSVGAWNIVLVVDAVKFETAIVADILKLISSVAVVIDSSSFFVRHCSPLSKRNSLRVYTAFWVACQVRAAFAVVRLWKTP